MQCEWFIHCVATKRMFMRFLLPFVVHVATVENKVSFTCTTDGILFNIPPHGSTPPRSSQHVFVMSGNETCAVDTEVRSEHSNAGPMGVLAFAKCHTYYKSEENHLLVFSEPLDNVLNVAAFICEVDRASASRDRRDVNVFIPPGGFKVKTASAIDVFIAFSNNSEISPVNCETSGSNQIYIRNPEPLNFRSLMAYTTAPARKCQANLFRDKTMAMISNCDQMKPIVLAFSNRESHNGIIGGSPEDFRAYKISCFGDQEDSTPSNVLMYSCGNTCTTRMITMILSVAVVLAFM